MKSDWLKLNVSVTYYRVNLCPVWRNVMDLNKMWRNSRLLLMSNNPRLIPLALKFALFDTLNLNAKLLIEFLTKENLEIIVFQFVCNFPCNFAYLNLENSI